MKRTLNPSQQEGALEGAALIRKTGRTMTSDSRGLLRDVREQFPDEQIVAALLRQLGWTHFTLLLPIKDSLRREFYAQMCRIERWNTRTLQKKIQSMLFEHTALSRKPEELAQIEIKALRESDRLTPDLVFRARSNATGSTTLDTRRARQGAFHDVVNSMEDLCHETFRTPLSTSCGECPPCQDSSPARRLESISRLGAQGLAVTQPTRDERARLVGARSGCRTCAHQDPSSRAPD